MIAIQNTPLGGAPKLPAERSGGLATELQSAFLPTPVTAVRDKLGLPNVVVVTTGQQPGLFTGPLYTIHKALSARGLALALERQWRRPVVPVFWVAGDDHDYAEAAPAHWIGPNGALTSVALPARAAEAPLRPLSTEPLPAVVVELLDRLESELPEGPARDQTLAWLRRHYRPGISVATAYGASLNELLAPLGVVCFDATHPAAKRAAAPVIRAAVDRATELERLLAKRFEGLEREGMAPDVHLGEGATLAFLEGSGGEGGGGGRDRLVLDGDGLKTRRAGERLAWAEFRRIVEEEPARLSPNVLLRPVIESALLPTVAYLAGPAELGYLALAETVFEALGVHRPLAVPRWSGLLVEPRVPRTLAKFGATLDDVMAVDGSLEQRVLKSSAPPDFEPAFAELRAALATGFDRVAAVASEIDPTFEKTVQTTRGGVLSHLSELEKRLLAAQKRRQGELVGQLERARTAVRPLGKPQERVLGVAGFLGRYGHGLIDQLADHIAAWYASALEGHAGTP